MEFWLALGAQTLAFVISLVKFSNRIEHRLTRMETILEERYKE